MRVYGAHLPALVPFEARKMHNTQSILSEKSHVASFPAENHVARGRSLGYPLLPKVNKVPTFALRRPHFRLLSRWAHARPFEPQSKVNL